MSRIILPPDAGGDQRKSVPQVPAQLAGSESINFVQFNTLLSAVNTFMQFVASVRAEPEDYKPGKAIDGGVVMAAENTLVGLCSRVDAMVADTPRWSMERQQSLEDAAKALYAEHQAFLREQRGAVATMQSPHVRFHPQVIWLSEMSQWAAVWGDAANAETSIIGVGASPEAAMRDFDDKFTGKIKYEKQQTVDTKGGTIPGSQPGQTNPPPDSKKTPPRPGRRSRKKPPAA